MPRKTTDQASDTQDAKKGKGGNMLYSVTDMMAALEETMQIVATQDPPPPPQTSIASFIKDHAKELEKIIQQHAGKGWTMATLARVLSERMAKHGITTQPETLAKAVRAKKPRTPKVTKPTDAVNVPDNKQDTNDALDAPTHGHVPAARQDEVDGARTASSSFLRGFPPRIP